MQPRSRDGTGVSDDSYARGRLRTTAARRACARHSLTWIPMHCASLPRRSPPPRLWHWPPAETWPGCRSRPGMGPTPVLPEPTKSIIPTVNVARAESWAEERSRQPPRARRSPRSRPQLEHPRWLYVLPNGDVLVAETNAPPKPEDGKGIKGRFMKAAMKKAGAAVAEPESHHSAARCAWRWHRRDPHGVHQESEFAVWHGAVGQRASTSRIRMRCCAFRTSRAPPRSPSLRRSSSICRPGRSIITGRRTSSRAPMARTCTSRWARTATSRRTASSRKKGAPRSGKSIAKTGEHRIFASGLRNPNGLAWEPRTACCGPS